MRLIDADFLIDKFSRFGDGILYNHEDLISYVEEAPIVEVQKWIPIKEKLPDLDKSVLIFLENPDRMAIANRDPEEEDLGRGPGGYYYTQLIKAWMPLPEPYKIKEDTK